MRVDAESLPGEISVEILRSQDNCPIGGIHAGEIVGFHCQVCGAVDETLRQIIHEDDCPLAGEHGRDLYDDLPRLEAELETPELDEDHPITMFEADFSGSDSSGSKHGCVIAFRCDECGNSDETLWEIVHDEACSLSGRLSSVDAGDALARDVPARFP